jgi:hypothetical protein
MHPINSIKPKIGVSYCFATAWKLVRNGPNRCHYHTNSLNEIASEFFTTNALHPLHFTQNSCFRAFRTISLLKKDGAKQAEQVQLTHKFAKWSCVGIFGNERTRSTPFDPKLMYCGCFKPFRYCTNIGAKRVELVPLMHKFTKQSCVATFRNEHTWSTPFDQKLMF